MRLRKHFITSLLLVLALATMSPMRIVQARAAKQKPVPDLERQVRDAVEIAKHGDYSAFAPLHSRTEAVLPLLEKYVNAPEPAVRFAIVGFLAYPPPSQKAIGILTRLVADTDYSVSQGARSDLRLGYQCSQVVGWGGQTLKHNIRVSLGSVGISSDGILLLGCFHGDTGLIPYLKTLRKRMIERVKTSGTGTAWAIQETILPLDVALADLRDQEATARVRALMTHPVSLVTTPKGGDTLFVLENLKFVNSRETLLSAVEMLKNKQPAKRLRVMVEISPAPRPSRACAGAKVVGEYRLCDVALVALAAKAKINLGVPDTAFDRRFSDAELSLAHKKLRRYFSTEWQPWYGRRGRVKPAHR